MNTFDFLHELNKEQYEAATIFSGPLCIVAGAGTGKTKTITYRIAHLIQQGVAPEQILAITFTNKAAKEMKERIYELLKKNSLPTFEANRLPFVSTFHALGVHILKEHGYTIHIPKYFSIADPADQTSFIKEAMKKHDIDTKTWDPKTIKNRISRAKGDLIDPTTYQNNAHSDTQAITGLVWRAYEDLLSKHKTLDFDDLLVKPYELLTTNREVLAQYQNLWQYLHIDEYQDTNTAQYELAKLLGEAHQNVCVVGDTDQNIYSWRGADYRNMLTFKQTYPEAQFIHLTNNYRSTETILGAAEEVIRHNEDRIDKTLTPTLKTGEPIKVHQAYNEYDEAEYIAETIEKYIQEGTPRGDIAVLYRTNFQSRVLEEAMLKHNISYQLVGTKFFDRKEVKEALAYLKAANNRESLTDLKRALTVPKRGLGQASTTKILSGKEHELSTKQQKSYQSVLELLDIIKQESVQRSPSEVMELVVAKSGLEELYKQKEEDSERVENLHELVSFASRYDTFENGEGIEKLIEDAALMSDQDELSRKEETDRVKLMTVHAAKGLEFNTVFISGLETELFPQEKDTTEDSEEERRLMYVALTRAKHHLHLTYTITRRIFGEARYNLPSEFINDIPDALLENTAPSTPFEDTTDTNQKETEEGTVYLDW